MARLLRWGNYGVYVWDERAAPHHLPHAHIKHRGRKVARVYLLTLEIVDLTRGEQIPTQLIELIAENQEALLAAWESNNDE